MLLKWQSGKFGRNVNMTCLPHYFRQSWIALAAVIGMLSVVGNASASTRNFAPQNGTLACCLKRICTVCCCPPASASSGPLTTGRSVALLSREGSFSSPARPCECRSSEPGSPASRQESRSSEGRGDEVHGEPVQLNVLAPTAVIFARPVAPTASPSKSPLYLRHARLLI
jgi:hypothetical protein